MNKIYRLKFSKRLNQLVAVSEITVGHDRNSGSNNDTEIGSSSTIVKFLKLKLLAGMISILSFGFATQTAMANGLQGMEVVNGTASMSVNGKNTTITNTPDAIINWKQFNINQDELVRFVQESSNSAVFNRVTSDQISQLKGALNSNGHVFLINPNGIVMGKDAVINAAGFTASTLNISDKDLKARNFNFEQAKDKAMAQIVNNGLISVSKNGSVNLIGGSVKNNGVIKVEDGNILLLAGQKVTISDITNPTITYSVVAPKNEAVNLGTIFAKNGKIQMHAGSVVNKGTLNANSVRKDKSGTIILSAKEGEANIDGTVTLNNANFKAGSLTITGKKVVLNSGAKVELTGKQGGTVYIGGDERGQGKIQLAEKTEIKQGASVNVSGSEKGGKAIVWGDRAQVDGKITAKGKDKKNSGFVETSGKYLGVGKTAKVEAKEWLLDPYNVHIVSDSENQSQGGGSRPAITISGTEQDVKILNTTIQNALNQGTNVTITTTEPAGTQPVGGQGNFTVEADIVKSAGTYANLTMIANDTFTQKKGTSIKATEGKLNLKVTAGKNLVLKGNIDTKEGTLNISTKGDATLEGATVKGKGAISIDGETSGNPNRTLEVKGNTTLKGYGDDGLSIKVSDKAKIKGTWEGDINVAGNVSYVHTLADHTKESHHDWKANLNVNNGKFKFSDLNNHNENVAGITQEKPILNISENVNFNVENAEDIILFDVKQHGGQSGVNSPLKDKNSSYISKLATHINGDMRIAGSGKVTITSSAPENSVIGGILIKSNEIVTDGTATLNLIGKALSEDSKNPPAIVIENNLTLNSKGNSTINIHGSAGQGSDAVWVGKNVKLYDESSAKDADVQRNLTLLGNNINITAAQRDGKKNASKITVTGEFTTDAKNVYLGDKDDKNGVRVSLYGNTTLKSGNVTLNSNGENVNSQIKLTNLKNNANLSITGSKVTFDGKTNSTNSMTVNATNDADNVILVNGDFASTGNLNITANGGMLAPAGTAYQFDFKGENTNIELKKDLQLRGKVNTKNTVNWTADKIKLGGDISQEGGHLTLTTKTQDIQTDATNKIVNGEPTNSENNTITFNGNDKSKLTINTSALNGNYGKIKFKKYGNDLTLNSTTQGGEVALKGKHDNKTKMGIEFEDTTLNVGAGKLNVETTVTGKNDLAIKKADGNENLDVTVRSTNEFTGKLEAGSVAINATNIGTEAGSSITATEKDVTLTASNNLTNAGAVDAKVNANLEGKNITNSGSVTATEGKVGVNASEKFTNTETGNLTGKAVDVEANDIETKAGSSITATEKDVTLTASNNLTNGGNVNAAKGDVTLKGDTLTNSGNVSAQKDVLLKADTLTNSGTVTATEGDVTLKGVMVTNHGGTVTATNGKVGVTASKTFMNATGSLTGKAVDVEAKDILAVKESIITATEKDVMLSATNSLLNDGRVAAKGDTILKGATLTNEGSVTAQEGDVTLRGETLTNDGHVTAAKGDATLKGTTVTNSGTVTAETGKVGVNASDKFTNTATGNLTGKTGVAITANDADVAGKVTAETGKASVIAQNKATISGAVSGQDVELEGKKGLTINQDATVTATEGNATLKGSSIEQNGTVKAKQNATLEGGTVTNSGSVTSTEGKVGVNASDKFTNTATGNLTGKTGVAITANDADVAGKVTAETGKASVIAQNKATISGAVSGQDVELEGKKGLT
ncbi:filamentous hemagglutinin N-terminal domain-containing protein, partial [Haemophilus haemolyticus]